MLIDRHAVKLLKMDNCLIFDSRSGRNLVIVIKKIAKIQHFLPPNSDTLHLYILTREMSSILADQWRPRLRAQMRAGGRGSGSQPMSTLSTAVHMGAQINF
jgi:hypothetical protein